MRTEQTAEYRRNRLQEMKSSDPENYENILPAEEIISVKGMRR